VPALWRRQRRDGRGAAQEEQGQGRRRAPYRARKDGDAAQVPGSEEPVAGSGVPPHTNCQSPNVNVCIQRREEIFVDDANNAFEHVGVVVGAQ